MMLRRPGHRDRGQLRRGPGPGARARRKHRLAIVNSVNPYRLQGQKTAAFEICDELGDAPDFLALPVGNAGNITAYWMGFREYYQAGKASRLPRMLGFQAAGAAPLVDGQPVDQPETVATAIRIGQPGQLGQAPSPPGTSRAASSTK